MTKRRPKNMQLFKKRNLNFTTKILIEKEERNKDFEKENKSVALGITLYITALILICILFSNNKVVMNLLAYVLSPFTMGLTFFILTTMKEKKVELDKKYDQIVGK